MRSKSFIFIATILILLIWSPKSFSLKEDTHRAINQHAAQNTVNGFSLDNYLNNNLGFKAGSNEVLKGVDAGGRYIDKKIFWWLGEGGFQEDEPLWRSFRHFHNPLETWDRAGLKGSTLGRSSIVWAQSTDQSYGHYSWQDVREYFYVALTGKDFTGNNVTPLPGETEKEKRERYLANTFRGVGQQMHLIEDASVPLHTRDDMHVNFSYEGWVENLRHAESGTFDTWLANAKSFDKSILNLSLNPL